MSDRIIVTALDMVELNLLRAYAPLRRELERAIVVSSALVPADVATMNSRVRRLKLEQVLFQPERLGNTPFPRAP